MRQCLKLVLGVVVLCSATALAEQPTMEEMKSTIDQLQATIKAQQGRLDQLETRVDQDMKAEMAKVARELAADADKQGATPGWLENLEFYGDLRLRYQNDCADDDGVGTADTRKAKMRNRVRFRLRFGIIKSWLDDQVKVVFRLASGHSDWGTESDPATTNQTFTNAFSEKNIWIDRAYAIYEPKAIPGLTIAGGKVPVPFVHTDLIWDEDVNPEGFWAQYTRAFGPIQPFINGGYFIANEVAPLAEDQYDTVLMFYQLGTHWQLCKAAKWTFAASLYDYDHVDSDALIAAGFGTWRVDYQMTNITNKVHFTLFNLPWSAYFDWVHNSANGLTTGAESMDDGYAAGVKVGQNKKKGDWSASYKYAYIEAFSTPWMWNDSEFNHTNSRGHVIGAKYNVTDFLTVGASVYLLQGISENLEGVDKVTTLVDAVWSF